MADVKIKITTEADLKAARELLANTKEQTQAAKELKAALDASDKAQANRLKDNLAASRAARESSNFGDNSGAREARIQRRLEAQRAETEVTQASVPILDGATAATDRLTNSKKLLEGSLKRAAGQFPILHTAVHALKDPVFGAAAAFAALSAAVISYANQSEARLQSLIDRLSGGINKADEFAKSIKTRMEESKIAQENFNQELQKTVDALNTIDEITSRHASADDRAEREQQAALGLEKTKALSGVTDPVKRGEIEADFAGRSRRVSEEFAGLKARRLAEAQRFARQQAAEAKVELPDAREAHRKAKEELDRNETQRRELEEYQKFLEEDIRTADQFTRDPNEARLHAATWGIFGKPWKPGMSKEQAKKELERVKGITSGFGADRTRDAHTRKEWEKYIGALETNANGGERFTGRFNEASAEAGTRRRIGAIADRTEEVKAAEEQLKRTAEALNKLLEVISRGFTNQDNKIDTTAALVNSITRSDR